MERPAFETSATFQDLHVLLREPACALCGQEAQSEQRYFDTLLYENVTSPGTETRLRASHGFCHRHLQTLMALRDPLATAILYRGLLLERTRLLARWHVHRPGRWTAPPQQPPPTLPCPACEAEAEASRRGAEVLAASLDNGALADEWQASAGLCWPHFLQVRPRCRAGRAVLDDVQAHVLDALTVDVEALIDSFDYQSEAERPPRVESAWRRVVAAISGRFEGGRPQNPVSRTVARRRAEEAQGLRPGEPR